MSVAAGRILVVCLLACASAARGAVGQEEAWDWSGWGHTLGDTTAIVRIVELGDFACSACAGFAVTTWPTVRQRLVETGRVHWRYVPFMLGFRRGKEAALAAECAAVQGGFWPMHDRLFEGRDEWTRGRRPQNVFRRYAEEAGLDAFAFEACYDDEVEEDRIEAATRLARDRDVRETPTFFVNGRRAIGALPWERFLALVEAAEREAGR